MENPKPLRTRISRTEYNVFILLRRQPNDRIADHVLQCPESGIPKILATWEKAIRVDFNEPHGPGIHALSRSWTLTSPAAENCYVCTCDQH